MKTYFRILLGLILPVGFSACQKEIGSDRVADLPEPKLARIILLDTTIPAPMDTLRIDGYKYDNSGRLIYYFSMLDNTGGILDTAFKKWFFYNGTSASPNKFIYNELTNGVLYDTDTTFLEFYSEGYVKLDSNVFHLAGDPPFYSSNYYSRSGNIVRETGKAYGPLPATTPVIFIANYYQLLSGDNIQSQFDTSGDYRYEFVNTFDGRNNPVFKADPVRSLIFYQDDYIFANTNKENITSTRYMEKHIPSGSIDEQRYRYEYDYNAARFPVVAREYDVTSGSPVYLKYIYKYF